MHRGQSSSIGLVERLVLASFASPVSLTRLELEELTGLSRTVVAGVVASLVARGELTQARQPPAPGARGRPPARFQRTALLPPVLMIALRKDWSTTVSSLSGDGASSEARECAPWLEPWHTWSRSVKEAAGRLHAAAPWPPRLAVLSVPFPVGEAHRAPRPRDLAAGSQKATGGRVLPRSPWLEEDPRPALAGLLGCTVLMVNDANLAALGEARFGAGRGRRAVFHICVADGIGAGFVFDGRLFTGAHGFSGELAHVQVRADGPRCVCGSRGCLITEKAVRGLWTRPILGKGAELGPLVGRALAPLATLLDPDCVVVDARLAAESGPFITGIIEELARRCPPELAGSIAVVAGDLDDAERHGALAAADAHATALICDPDW
ncbi:MAG TPA: ROK family protein [Trebonia sp.]|nr:ROK family protein [Trebonia sp.]